MYLGSIHETRDSSYIYLEIKNVCVNINEG